MSYKIGIDQSFSNTGICVLDKNSKIVLSTSIPTYPNVLDMYKIYPNETYKEYESKLLFLKLIDSDFNLTKKKKDLTKQDKGNLKVSNEFRINLICNKLDAILADYTFSQAGIETISFGSMGNTADLGRLLGAIERTIYMRGISLSRFEPKSVKKFAGKGNYSKEEMLEAVPMKDRNMLESSCPKNTRDKFIGLDDRVDSYWIAKML